MISHPRRTILALALAASSGALTAQTLPAYPPLPPLPGTEPRSAPLPRLAPPPVRKRFSDGMDCLVEPHMVVSVGSPVDGVLEEVLADRGAVVRKGQVIARLQSGVESAAVDLARARVDFGRRKLERNEALYQKQLISAHERDEMETELRLHEQELRRDQESLKLRTIFSPLEGVVVERRLAPGDLIRADRSVVLKLAQIDPLHIEVVAPAEFFGSARVGMTGTVNLRPIYPSSFDAKVVVVDKLIDAASGTFGLRLELPNPGYRIPAGIKCTVQFAK